MNVSLFLANRVGLKGGSSLSRFIIRIAIIAVALGVTVMILTSCMIAGFRKEIKTKIFGFWGHIDITDSKVVLDSDIHPIKYDIDLVTSLSGVDKVTYRDEESGESLTSNGGIAFVQPYCIMKSILSTKTEFEGIVLKGISKEYNTTFLSKYLIDGSLPRLADSIMSRDILISTKTAQRLNLDIGDKVIINFAAERKHKRLPFKICGTYKTGLAEYDASFAIIDMRHIQKLLNWEDDEVAGLEVFVDDISELEIINDYIFTQKLPLNLYSRSIRSKSPAIFDWLDLQDINEHVIFWLMLLVTVINMITTLMILIIDRSKMIGVLLVLGMKTVNIRKVFLYYALFVLFWGLLLGNALGLGIAWLEDAFHFIKLSEDDYYLSYAPIYIDYWQVLKINIITIVVTFLVLIIPTYMITKVKPIKTLTFN